jgi:acetyl-CoA carboxylase biotin carboxylase subunit
MLKRKQKKWVIPLFIKATAGGGGKGMRIVWKAEEMEKAFDSAKMEATTSFKNDGIYGKIC